MDIGERKKLEAALAASEARLRVILAAAQMGTWDRDLQTGRMNWSPETERLWRLPGGGGLGGTLEEFLACIHPDDRDHLSQFLTSGETAGVRVEYRTVWPDGAIHWIASRAELERDEAGVPRKLLGVAMDITAHKVAEHNEERQRVALETARDAVISIGGEGEIVFVNPAATRIFGYAASELIGQPFTMLMPERVRKPHEAERAWSGQQTEMIGRRNNGEEFPMEVWLGEVAAGGRRAFTAFVRDISERQRAGHAMAHLAALVGSSNDAITSITLDGTIMSWNAGAQRLYGYSAEEAVGRGISMLLPPGRQHELSSAIAGVKQGRSIENYETERVRKDGRLVELSITLSPIRDAGGDIIGISGIARDISWRKQAEAALRESEQKFRQLAEKVREVFWTADRISGHTIYVSPNYEEVWGANNSFLEAVHPQDRSRVEAAKRRQKATPGPLQLRYRVVQDDGSIRWISDRSLPVRDKSGQIDRFVGVAEDITERLQAERELRQSLDQTRALAGRLQSIREEERTRAAREIHDELGQALTAIKIELSALLHELPAAPAKAADILNLIDGALQSVRKIATGLRPGILDDLGLAAAVEWAVGEFQARTATQCRLELPPDDVIISPQQSTALFRILQETLTNVVRHAGATEVHVRLAKENGDLLLEVRDNGRGLDAGQAAGRSLGILGMRERAALLGGELYIRGAPGQGTTMTVRIPEADDAHEGEPN